MAGFQRVKPFGGFGQSPTFQNSIHSKKRANSPQGYEASGGSRLHRFPAKPCQAGSRAKPLAGFQRVKPFGGLGQSPTFQNSIPPKSERTARRAMRRASAADCIGAKAKCAGPNPCPPCKRHGAAFRHDRTPRVAGAWALPLFCAKPAHALELMQHFAYFLRPVHIRVMDAWYDQSIRCGCAARVCGIGWSAGLGLPGCGAGPPCEHAARPSQRMARRAYFSRFCMETHAQSPWKTFRVLYGNPRTIAMENFPQPLHCHGAAIHTAFIHNLWKPWKTRRQPPENCPLCRKNCPWARHPGRIPPPKARILLRMTLCVPATRHAPMEKTPRAWLPVHIQSTGVFETPTGENPLFHGFHTPYYYYGKYVYPTTTLQGYGGEPF